MNADRTRAMFGGMETIRVRPFTTHVQFTTGKPWLPIEGRLDRSDEFFVRFWGFGIALRTAAVGRDSIGPWALLPLVERDFPELPSGFLMVTREYDGDGLDGGLIQLWSTPEVTFMRSRTLCSLYFDPNGNLELASGPGVSGPPEATELHN